MITRENYSIEHIMKLHESSKRDPNLIERVLFAFGLLEALRRVELPFIFKGGTSLLLILDKPMRLSTDIDIIVEPGTEVDVYLEKAAKIFPFKAYEEQIRKGKNNIEKRHFKFQFESPRTKGPVEIILDILFESSKYANTIDKNINCELLLTEPEYLQVKVPDVNSILADKLTAFAPHTTGVLVDTRKDLEIMKQMFDVYSLIGVFQTLANMDALTNIYNRYGFDTLAERMIAKNPRNHYIAALLDVDDFKLINDVYGHTYGDRALTFLYKGEEHSFYISLGYAEYPQSGSNHSQLIRCADAALKENS